MNFGLVFKEGEWHWIWNGTDEGPMDGSTPAPVDSPTNPVSPSLELVAS